MLPMTCGICGTQLIEDCDYDGDNEGDILTSLHCPKCEASVNVLFNVNREIEED